jgi:hypothetical protein
MFLEPRWAWAARSSSMSWLVALKTLGRLEGAMIAVGVDGEVVVAKFGNAVVLEVRG